MKKLIILALMIMLVPAGAMAMKGMDHKTEAKEMDHGKMEMDHDSKKMDHGSMDMSGMKGVVMLQDEVVEGVKGSAHLMDSEDGKGKMLVVMFTDEKSGAMLSDGRCAVKVESPDEKVGEAQKMMKHTGMFGTGVKFDQKGMYHFKVGTKLADGEKRTFHFHHEN